MPVLTLDDVDIRGKRVLIREDLNVPVSDGQVTSDARIVAAVPTIRRALDAGARVLLMSHLGRPTEGLPVDEQVESSLAPVARHLETLLGQPVPVVTRYLDGVDDESPLVLLENVRVNAGEKANDKGLSERYAQLCDVFVMDAFGTAHRAQASTEGVVRYAPVACAGPLLAAELAALSRVMRNPASPLLAIVGGSKVSTKLDVLDVLSQKVDQLVVGGGIANTFLAAIGKPIGISLHEPDLLAQTRSILDRVAIPLPVDVVVGTEISPAATAIIKSVDDVKDDEMILDIGPESRDQLGDLIAAARTILWNGPVGVFEHAPFAAGTEQLARQIAASSGFSLAGGGDTLAAIDQFGVKADISYISTGGGAFLEFVEGRTLPAVAALEARGGA
jgi:phosphoglycerate kinase